MTEDLQNLLDRIQKDGVEKAESEASRILDEAKTKASEIVKKANDEAARILAAAKKDADSFAEKGRKSLEQAARDTVISARTGIQSAVKSLIRLETAKAMTDNAVSSMLAKLVDAYCTGATEIHANKDDVEKLKSFVLAKLGEQARSGITIVPDGSILKGFKAVLKDKNIEHDLTDAAITEALSRILRPHIAEILTKSV